MSKTVSIDNVVVDTEKFRQYNQEGQRLLEEIEELQTQFKELVEVVAKETKLKKPAVSGFLKARYKAKTKEAVRKGTLYDVLDGALDN